MSDLYLPWTVSVATERGQRVVASFATKREAVQAMMAIRQPKTPILRVGRDYLCQEAKRG